MTINGQSSSILSVLVLGAGTDYALLLVSRYREELRKHEDKHEALRLALRTAGPAIFASGLTVIAALLTLSIAKVNATSGLGPIGAIGIALAMLSMLTLLPAMLAITGRRAFWRPSIFGWGNGIPHVGDEGVRRDPRRLAPGRRARRALPARACGSSTTVVLLVLCFGILNFSDGLTSGNGYRDEGRGGRGPGAAGQVVPERATRRRWTSWCPTPRRREAVTAAVSEIDGVGLGASRPAGRGAAAGVLLNATLEDDPYSKGAETAIEPIRSAAREAGGQTCWSAGRPRSSSTAARPPTRDTRVIVPIALLVVFLILMVLLRAVIAPLLLIGDRDPLVRRRAGRQRRSSTTSIFGFPGSDPSLPLYAFVFLVALGIDYNIFLMARVREETQRHGTRRGMMRGLAVTGGVITSAGHRAGRDVLRARRAAAGVPDRDRLRRRLRRAAGHLPGALGAGARARARHRPEDLVAVDGWRRRTASTGPSRSSSTSRSPCEGYRIPR